MPKRWRPSHSRDNISRRRFFLFSSRARAPAHRLHLYSVRASACWSSCASIYARGAMSMTLCTLIERAERPRVTKWPMQNRSFTARPRERDRAYRLNAAASAPELRAACPLYILQLGDRAPAKTCVIEPRAWRYWASFSCST